MSYLDKYLKKNFLKYFLIIGLMLENFSFFIVYLFFKYYDFKIELN